MAVSEPELQDLLQLRPGLGDLVLAGDADVDGPGGDELRDVLRPEEQDLDVLVPGPDVKPASDVLAEVDARLGEQLDGPLVQASFVGYSEFKRHLAPLEIPYNRVVNKV